MAQGLTKQFRRPITRFPNSRPVPRRAYYTRPQAPGGGLWGLLGGLAVASSATVVAGSDITITARRDIPTSPSGLIGCLHFLMEGQSD